MNVARHRLKRDLYAGRNGLLLRGEGADNSTVAIQRAYGTAVSITTNGDAKVRTDAPLFSGYGSYAFDGTGDYFQCANVAQLHNRDFLFECWANSSVTSAAVQTIMAQTNGGVNAPVNQTVILYFYNGTIEVAYYQGSLTPIAVITSSSGKTDGTKRHIRTGRVGNTVYLTVEGTSVGTAAVTGAMNAVGQTVYLGAHGPTAGLYLNGRIDFPRLRIDYGGTTGNFTVPTQPFPIY